MTTHWTTTDLPATAWDPEPYDDGQDDDGPSCLAHAGLWGQGTPLHRLDTATTITVVGEIL